MRLRVVIVAVVGVALVVAAILLNATLGMLSAASSPVYALGDVQAGLRHNPRAWVGRVVAVRGIVGQVGFEQGGARALEAAANNVPLVLPGSPSRSMVVHLFMQPDLSHADLPYRPLQVRVQQAQTPDPLPPALRDVPWLRGLIPAPRQVRGGVPVIYRIRLLPRPRRDRACISRSCDEGVLLTPIRW